MNTFAKKRNKLLNKYEIQKCVTIFRIEILNSISRLNYHFHFGEIFIGNGK